MKHREMKALASGGLKNTMEEQRKKQQYISVTNQEEFIHLPGAVPCVGVHEVLPAICQHHGAIFPLYAEFLERNAEYSNSFPAINLDTELQYMMLLNYSLDRSGFWHSGWSSPTWEVCFPPRQQQRILCWPALAV